MPVYSKIAPGLNKKQTSAAARQAAKEGTARGTGPVFNVPRVVKLGQAKPGTTQPRSQLPSKVKLKPRQQRTSDGTMLLRPRK